jgi:hypothetical protein
MAALTAEVGDITSAVELGLDRSHPLHEPTVLVGDYEKKANHLRPTWFRLPGWSLVGGAEGSRTPDPKTASLVLSQLSYSPTRGITLQVSVESCQEWCRRGESNP